MAEKALADAIGHIDDLLEDDGLDCDCRSEHEQLKEWLKELESLRADHERLLSEVGRIADAQAEALERMHSTCAFRTGIRNGKKTLIDDMIALGAAIARLNQTVSDQRQITDTKIVR